LGRLKTLSCIALLGFVLGASVYTICRPYIPSIRRFLSKAIPQLLQADWFLAGVLGAVILTVSVVVWAYTTGSEWE